ncbi:MAG: DNA methylase N-4/N-6 [Cyanobacteria bacterium CYA]|nr:MAG: DNA methylase N-4/N-6 [Cyanobacteria bacterium CYA]
MPKAARTTTVSARVYGAPLPATRKGPLFNAHAYSTKIAPEAIALMIASHTKPNATVFDGFGGSGTTALAALLCSKPTPEMLATAKRLRLPVTWGSRNAVVYELSGLGSFLGQTLCSKPDPLAFRHAAEAILEACAAEYGWLYEAQDDEGRAGVLRYAIWTECIRCRYCRSETSLWESSVTLDPAHISDQFTCSKCGRAEKLNGQPRAIQKYFDDLLGHEVTTRKRILARVYGSTRGHTWNRDSISQDRDLVARIQETPVPPAFPLVPLMGKGGENWGDLYRAGYHEGITHVHHFYTRRNLIAIAAVNRLIAESPRSTRDILRLWLSSYNMSHSTLMSRVVAKQGQRDLVTTSNQPGVLYISGLPVEKNVFDGLRRKITTIAQALECLRDAKGTVRVVKGSCTHTDLPDQSIDYVFTDPPFGGNIPYSEANFLSEAWLGRYTDTTPEAILSPAQGKGLSEYEDLLSAAFRELNRIMKPNAQATVVFHSTSAAVWTTLLNAFEAGNFSVETSNVLDKRQGSFKQVTAPNAVKGDALILLGKSRAAKRRSSENVQAVMRGIVACALRAADQEELTSQRLYSRFVTRYIDRQSEPPLGAAAFYRELDQHFVHNGELTLNK